MAISEELKKLIEQELFGLQESQIVRSGLSFNDFSKDYSILLGQVNVDRVPLEQAGFDFTLMAKYEAYLELLGIEHAKRVNAEGIQGPFKTEAEKRLPKAVDDRKLLLVVIRHIVNVLNTNEARAMYKMIMKGSGEYDTFHDVAAGVGFVRSYMDIASQIRPGGKVINEEFLKDAEDNVLGLLKLRGAVYSEGSETSTQLDRLNCLVTLCILASRRIKTFAEAAFVYDQEYYNQKYANLTIRNGRSTT